MPPGRRRRAPGPPSPGPRGPRPPGPDRRPGGSRARHGPAPRAGAGPAPGRGRPSRGRSSRAPTASTRTPRTRCSRRSRSRPPGPRSSSAPTSPSDSCPRSGPARRSSGSAPSPVRAMEELLAEHGFEPPHSGAPGAPRRRSPGPRARPCRGARRRRRPRGARQVPARPPGRAGSPTGWRPVGRSSGAPPTSRGQPRSWARPWAARRRRTRARDPRPPPRPTASRVRPPATARPPGARRRSVAWQRGALLGTWTAVARDLAVAAAGSPRRRPRPGAPRRPRGRGAPRRARASVVAFLDRLVRAAELLEANANPELLVDILVVAWPSAHVPPDAARPPARPAADDEHRP